MPRLCEAWPVMPFEECLVSAKASYRKLKSGDIKASGSIPVIDQGETFISGYTDDPANEYPGALPVIVFGDHTRRFKFVDFKFAVGAQGTHLLYPRADLTPKFFYHYLSALDLESQGYSRHYKFLKQALVPIPPAPEQRRIVAKLETLFCKVDACQQRLAKIPVLLKRFRQSVLAAACCGRLTADWRQENSQEASSLLTVPAKRPLPLIEEEELLFDAPESWKWFRLGTLATFINGDRGKCYPNKSEYVSTGIPFINAGHILPNGTLCTESMHFITREKFDSLRSGKIQTGDLLYCLRGTLGKTAIVESYAKGAIASSLVIVRTHEPLHRKFAFYYLTSRFGAELVERFDNGSAQPNLSAESVRHYLISLPPFAEQQEIVRRVEALFALADQIETRYLKAKAYIEKLTPSILAKAFRGELVPQDPNDEPASVLLERIRQQRNGENSSTRRSPRPSRHAKSLR